MTDRDYEIELSALRAELATVKAERDDLKKRLAWAEEMRDVWRRKDQDGAWHWAGDGSDFPETLVCPVLMSAATLRELLADRDDWRDIAIGMRDFGGPPLPKHQRQFGEVLERYLEKLRKECA